MHAPVRQRVRPWDRSAARGGRPPYHHPLWRRAYHRPRLAEALALCRLHNAVLIIAKLDRLARNVAFVSRLMEEGVEFVACDFPEANRLTVHILAAVAEHEREMISVRTKAALAAAKARGQRLGNPRNLKHHDEGRAKGCAVVRANAAERARDLLPTIEAAQSAGATSLRQLAVFLNGRGIPTARGGAWSANQVRRVLDPSRVVDVQPVASFRYVLHPLST